MLKQLFVALIAISMFSSLSYAGDVDGTLSEPVSVQANVPILSFYDKEVAPKLSPELHNVAIAGQELLFDGVSVDMILDKSNRAIGIYMNGVFDNGYSKPTNSLSKQIHILDSRIAINESHGNKAAVQRDMTKKQFLQMYDEMTSYLYRVHTVVSGYEERGTILEDSELAKERNSLITNRGFFNAAQEGAGKVNDQLNHNASDLYSLSYVYGNILNWVIQNPEILDREHWTKALTITGMIEYINNNSVSEAINQKLNMISLDVGGISLFIIIFCIIIMGYPIVFKTSKFYIDKYILKEDALTDTVDSSKEFAYVQLRKPIKILLVFLGLDLSTQALLYKTDLVSKIDDISFVVYVVILSWIVLKVINTLVSTQIERLNKDDTGMRKELFNLIIHTVKAILMVVSSIIILTHFGISIAAILSTLGIGGLAFALAAKDTLSNLFGGVAIMIDNVFRLDDWVKIGKSEGTVAQIGLRSTTIRTFDNALITIPNSQLSTADVLNWNRRKVGRRIKMMLGVTYESKREDVQSAVQEIRDMLKNHKGISNPTESFNEAGRATHFYKEENIHGIKNTQLVFLDRFNEYSMDIMVYCFSKSVDWEQWLVVKEDVLYKISEIFEKNNVEFAYPTEIKIERKIEALPE